MATVRVRKSDPVTVLDPETGVYIALVPDTPYDSSSPLVREYPWAFERDNVVEQATAGPGERRNR